MAMDTTTSSNINIAGRKRHGARNQHKMKDFAKWLIQTFPSASLERVLDVASGKGELAARLALCHQSQVTLVDPRGPADVALVYLQQVVPKLPNKWQQRLQLRLEQNDQFVQDMVQARCHHLVTYFTETTVRDDPVLLQAIQDCSLLVGMHADSATECIVDVALQFNKPFVVVPCCVFPNLFSQRFLHSMDLDPTQSSSSLTPQNRVPVRSWEQFCHYLLQKDERIKKHTLPFEGRNVALYWNGARSDSADADADADADGDADADADET